MSTIACSRGEPMAHSRHLRSISKYGGRNLAEILLLRAVMTLGSGGRVDQKLNRDNPTPREPRFVQISGDEDEKRAPMAMRGTLRRLVGIAAHRR